MLAKGFDAARGLSYYWHDDASHDFADLDFDSNTIGFDTIHGGILFLKGGTL